MFDPKAKMRYFEKYNDSSRLRMILSFFVNFLVWKMLDLQAKLVFLFKKSFKMLTFYKINIFADFACQERFCAIFSELSRY